MSDEACLQVWFVTERRRKIARTLTWSGLGCVRPLQWSAFESESQANPACLRSSALQSAIDQRWNCRSSVNIPVIRKPQRGGVKRRPQHTSSRCYPAHRNQASVFKPCLPTSATRGVLSHLLSTGKIALLFLELNVFHLSTLLRQLGLDGRDGHLQGFRDLLSIFLSSSELLSKLSQLRGQCKITGRSRQVLRLAVPPHPSDSHGLRAMQVRHHLPQSKWVHRLDGKDQFRF